MSNSQSTRPDISPYGMPRPTFTPRAGYLREDLGRAQPQTGIGNDGDWPHRSFLEFSALPTAASCARLHATALLSEWDLTDLRDDAQVVVSELVSNAYLASAASGATQATGRGHPAIIRLWLLADAPRLVIVVWDATPQPPVLTRASTLDEHGRGLLLVSALGSDWGSYTRPGVAGKFVWAELRRNLNGSPA